MAKHIVYGDNEQPSNNREVFLGATKAFIGGYLGGRMGHKATQTTNLYFPNASTTTKTTVDAFFGSGTSTLYDIGTNKIIENNVTNSK